MNVICFDNMRRPNPLKTSEIVEIEPTASGVKRFRVTTLEYVALRAKELGRGNTYTSEYRFNSGVFSVEISDGSLRVKSVQDCRENGLSQHPLFDESRQQIAYSRKTAAVLDAYRKSQLGRKPSSEELFEMQAAFGPGVEVVNIITGRRTTTPGKKVGK